MKKEKVAKYSIGLYIKKETDSIGYKIIGHNTKAEIVFIEESKGRYDSQSEALDAAKKRVECLAGQKFNLKKVL